MFTREAQMIFSEINKIINIPFIINDGWALLAQNWNKTFFFHPV